LQRPENFARWHDETPQDFVFAVKGPRFLTHMLKLNGAEAPLANFFASGLLRLGAKLGPILWQFPESMRYDEAKFETFLALLPRDTRSALALAKRHDYRLKGRSWLRTDANRPIRHAIEFRHTSFCSPKFVRQLHRYGVALVCADTVEWPLKMDLTADFIYCRLHGSQKLYVSGYSNTDLDCWAQRVKQWARGGEPRDADRIGPPAKRLEKGRDVFVYFDNDAKVRAPKDARGLAARLAQG
jgi:uncharacterized protein YecE (DUF72 family)